MITILGGLTAETIFSGTKVGHFGPQKRFWPVFLSQVNSIFRFLFTDSWQWYLIACEVQVLLWKQYIQAQKWAIQGQFGLKMKSQSFFFQLCSFDLSDCTHCDSWQCYLTTRGGLIDGKLFPVSKKIFIDYVDSICLV